jgi:hypothetical protein
LLALSLFTLAAFLEIFPRSDPDHLVRVLPPAFLLLCVLMISPLSVASRSAIAPFVVTAIIVLIGVRVTWGPQLTGGLRFQENHPLAFERGRGVSGSRDDASRLNAVVRFVQANTSPRDRILSVSRKMTSIYFFAARQNTTRLLWTDSAGIPEEELESVANRVREREFALILGGIDSDLSESDSNSDVEIIIRQIRDNYRTAAVVNGVPIYTPAP